MGVTLARGTLASRCLGAGAFCPAIYELCPSRRGRLRLSHPRDGDGYHVETVDSLAGRLARAGVARPAIERVPVVRDLPAIGVGLDSQCSWKAQRATRRAGGEENGRPGCRTGTRANRRRRVGRVVVEGEALR